MAEPILHTLPKTEIISGKTAIANLTGKGKWSSGGGEIKTCVLHPNGTELNRIMVSVPKRNFKRAVKRNLLKRRIREAYRLQKELLTCRGTDILFVYTSKEILDFSAIKARMESILTGISSKYQE